MHRLCVVCDEDGVVYNAPMPRYSEAMKAAWAKKTPEERRARGRALARHRWRLFNLRKNTMDFTTTIAGVSYAYSAESQTFVITAPDSVVTLGVAAVNGTGITPTEVDVKESDGSEETFVPEEARTATAAE